MTATSVVCPECGSPVAPGRLSCQSCGTLLASVVGAARPPVWAASPADVSEIDEDRPIASARRAAPAARPDADPAQAQVAEAAPVALAAPADPPKRARRLPRPKAPANPPAPAKARYVKSPPPESADLAPIDQTALFGPVPTVAPPILHDWSHAAPDPVDMPVASTTASRQDEARADGALAGAYLAPSATYTAPIAAGGADRGSRRAAPAQGPAWPSATAAIAPAHAGNGASAASSSGAPDATVAAAVPSRRLSDWLVIGGSTLAIIGFVVPWATDGVIGAVGTSYLARWGLANPGHLLLVAAVLAVLLLELTQNPVPSWFRSGILPILVGGLLVGLAFAYYARPVGGGAGVAVMLAGALVLIGGGVLASRPERHGTTAPTV